MAKNSKRRSKRKSHDTSVRAFGGGESRAAEFMTVGWLLTTLTTLVCEVVGAAATWFAQRNPQAVGIAALATVLLFAAVITGALALLLLAVAWKLRTVKPPRGITVFAVFVSAAPLVMLFLEPLVAR
jgi:hypothetical protein